MDMLKNIQVGKKYNYFDDGKISKNRKYSVTIKEIIPFKDIDEDTLASWLQELDRCHWLYEKETDYFLRADLEMKDGTIEEIFFVREINNRGWFSLGWWAGALDDDGPYAKALEDRNNHYL